MSEYTTRQILDMIEANGGPGGLDLAGADLSNLDLSEMGLDGIILSRWDKDNKTWIGTNLQGANLLGTNLQGASLMGANLQGASLMGANLQGAFLGGTNLRQADLRGADLRGGDLRGADLQRGNLRGADLQEVNLFAAKLQAADLDDANLRGAFLSDANAQGADLLKANLQGAILFGANLQGAALFGADLQGADLTGADLQGAVLFGADLQGADLTGADLQGATLGNANLRRADLRGADLRGTDLRPTDSLGSFLLGDRGQGADRRFAQFGEDYVLEVEIESLLGIKLYRARLDHTLLRRQQLGPAVGDEQAGEYREARDAYLALKQNFEGLGDYAAASWAYIKERKMEKACSAPWRARRFYGIEQLRDASKHKLPARRPQIWCFFVRHTAKWLGDWFVELLCGYGESIWRVLAWMAVLLIGSPLLFGLSGLLEWPDENSEIFFSLRPPWRYGYAYLQQFLYVLDAFTTASFAELKPATALTRVLSGLTALIGVFLTGLLGFVAGNRIRRS